VSDVLYASGQLNVMKRRSIHIPGNIEECSPLLFPSVKKDIPFLFSNWQSIMCLWVRRAVGCMLIQPHSQTNVQFISTIEPEMFVFGSKRTPIIIIKLCSTHRMS
jgi:hypothetical protein